MLTAPDMHSTPNPHTEVLIYVDTAAEAHRHPVICCTDMDASNTSRHLGPQTHTCRHTLHTPPQALTPAPRAFADLLHEDPHIASPLCWPTDIAKAKASWTKVQRLAGFSELTGGSAENQSGMSPPLLSHWTALGARGACEGPLGRSPEPWHSAHPS